MSNPPSGTVTFFFTDIEGSTKLWERYPEAMRTALARHDALVREAIQSNGGYVFKTIGDAFDAVFVTAPQALSAALAAQRALNSVSWDDTGPLRARIALHTGVAQERDGDYFGQPLNRVSRILSSGYGSQILLSEATFSLVRDSFPPEVTFRDLGQHRLRDLSRPERIFQVVVLDLPSDFPPLKSLDSFPNNLPNQLTKFIGRKREMEEVKQLLALTRLLTLTGAGGTGKTRLSLEVSVDLLETFADGVWFVELAAISDSLLVDQTIASVLGVREEPNRPLLTTLKDYLYPKNLMLILDNCEHLIEPAARTAETLLRACPNLKILAGSREPLGVAGEKTYRVPSLVVPNPSQLPPLEKLSQFDAVRLFVDRAVNLQPRFNLTHQNAPAVAHIVHRLDGIPLAIELSAACVKSISVEKIASRLDDQFNLLSMGSRTALPRQQTLNALIEWSYNLLSESERVLFRRLSVFVGSWTLEAAEEVCSGNGMERIGVLNLLTRLVDKSLVNVRENGPVEMRYRWLETIRQYALMKLHQSGEENDVRARHCDWYLAMAEDAELNLRGPRQTEWLNLLETEYDNLAASLDWVLSAQRAEKGLRYAGALWYFWSIRGYWNEGREQISRLLAFAGASPSSAARVKALNGAGYLALQQNDYAVAQKYFEESLEIARAIGDNYETARALHGLGALAEGQGDAARAREYLNQALLLFRELNSSWGIAGTLLDLGAISLNNGDYAEARPLFELCLPAFRELGDKRSVGKILGNLGLIAYFQGDYATARSLCEESLAIRRELKDKAGIANQLNNLAYIGLHQAEYIRARTLFVESLTLFAEIKSKRMIADTLFGLGSVVAAQKKPKEATRLFGAGQALLDTLAIQIEDANRAEYDRNVAAARSQLDEGSFTAAWAEGKAMTMEQAIAFALEEPRKD